jgi:hypothetical protein
MGMRVTVFWDVMSYNLKIVTSISEEPAVSIFKVEECSFTEKLEVSFCRR